MMGCVCVCVGEGEGGRRRSKMKCDRPVPDNFFPFCLYIVKLYSTKEGRYNAQGPGCF